MENIELRENTASVMDSERNLVSASWLNLLLSRIAPAAIFLLILMPKVAHLINFLRSPNGNELQQGRFAFYVAASSQASVILFLLLMIVLCIVRTPPIKKAQGLFPRITAIVGTFLMSIITIFPKPDLPLWGTVAATLLTLFGAVFSTVVLAQLGRSFSVMAEARSLVTTGPYAVVRHPLYLAEEFAMLGATLQFLSPFAVLIFVLHLLVQIQRMKNEEAVLRQVYPEYIAYQQRTARLIPTVY